MPIKTIITGVDLAAPSDLAVDRAVAIASRHRARLVLVHAQADDAPIAEVDNAMLQQLGEVSAAVRIEEARLLADRMDAIRARGVEVEMISRVGPPAEIIAGAAAERGAELICIGTYGNTGVSRLLLGSVADQTIRHASCDVLVCRGNPSTQLFAKPLAATDFSPASDRALRHAVEVVEPAAPIEVIHAWQLPTGSWGASLLGQARFPWSTVRDAVLSSAKSQADKLVARHNNIGHPLHAELVQGAPSDAITEAATKGHHDLIVVGTNGHRGFRRLLLGSVADEVISHAPCSVLVVHGENAGETTQFVKQ